MGASDLDLVIEQMHRASDEFVKGNLEPLKEAYSHREHVSLANPFGLPVRGWKQVGERRSRGSYRYRGGL